MSMLLELALVLQCDRAVPGPVRGVAPRPNPLPAQMARFFRGPHFDWSANVRLGPHAGTINDLAAVQMRRHGRAVNSTRVFSTFTSHALRILKFNSAWAAPRFGRYMSATPFANGPEQCTPRARTRAPRPLLDPSRHTSATRAATPRARPFALLARQRRLSANVPLAASDRAGTAVVRSTRRHPGGAHRALGRRARGRRRDARPHGRRRLYER